MPENLIIRPYGPYQWSVVFQWDGEPEPEQMIVFTKENDPAQARREAEWSLDGWEDANVGTYRIIGVELEREWKEDNG